MYESSARVEVGGDLYDFVTLDDGRLGVVLGDVTGHGVEATADMAMAKFVFRSLARDHPEPADFLAAVNDVIVDEIAPAKFITMAYLTVDPRGAARSAGGICMMLEDLAGFGEMIRNGGIASGRQVVPQAWITDIRTNGDQEAWRKGDMLALLPGGNYRSNWYNSGGASGAFMGVGIHGQWLYVDPKAELVIAKLSSQPLPVDQPMDLMHLDMFDAIARSIGCIGA